MISSGSRISKTPFFFICELRKFNRLRTTPRLPTRNSISTVNNDWKWQGCQHFEIAPEHLLVVVKHARSSQHFQRTEIWNIVEVIIKPVFRFFSVCGDIYILISMNFYQELMNLYHILMNLYQIDSIRFRWIVIFNKIWYRFNEKQWSTSSALEIHYLVYFNKNLVCVKRII